MKTTLPSSGHDGVYNAKDGNGNDAWFIVVEGKSIGYWRSETEAKAGYKVELRRAARRKARTI